MGSLGQVIQWLGLGLLLLMCPLLVVRIALRDRARPLTRWFWLFASISLILAMAYIWYHELDHWFRDVGDGVETRIFMAIVMVPIVVLLIAIFRVVVKRWLKRRSLGFQISTGVLFVGVTSFLMAWRIHDKGEKFLNFGSVAGFFFNVLGLIVGLGLLWKMVRRKDGEGRAAAARLILPCYLTSTIALGVMCKLFYEEEKYWVARNELWESSAEYPTRLWQIYEERQELEIREVLEHPAFSEVLQAGR